MRGEVEQPRRKFACGASFQRGHFLGAGLRRCGRQRAQPLARDPPGLRSNERFSLAERAERGHRDAENSVGIQPQHIATRAPHADEPYQVNAIADPNRTRRIRPRWIPEGKCVRLMEHLQPMYRV